jgi:hypothetical protein
MKKGELAVLICKPEYAYGANGAPPKIPPNATLKCTQLLLTSQSRSSWSAGLNSRTSQRPKMAPC